MSNQAQQDNVQFNIPADVEQRLRKQAEQQVKETIDEVALLAKFTAEARAKHEEKIRARVSELDQNDVQDLDSQGFPKKYYKITIFKGSNKTDLSYVPVQVNGYAWKIQRGEQVIVPSVVIDALNNAVTEVVVQSEGGLITRPAHRFPYQVIGEAPEEEYQAFRAKMREAGKQAAVLS